MQTSVLALTFALSFAVLGSCTPDKEKAGPLARALTEPVRLLCLLDENKESGGCYRECMTRNAAREGRAALEASKLLVAIAPDEDEETEVLLKDVRSSARRISETLDKVCVEEIDMNTPITPSVTGCAEARRKNQELFTALVTNVDDLARKTKARTKAELPSPRRCPRN